MTGEMAQIGLMNQLITRKYSTVAEWGTVKFWQE